MGINSTSGKIILLVGYIYYPSSDVGARRLFNFKKYLNKLGHQVTVLTVFANQCSNIDPKLQAKEIERDVIRTQSFGPINVPRRRKDESIWDGLTRRIRYLINSIASGLLVPDVHIGWAPYAISSALTLARTQKFDVVISTAKPWSDLVIGDRIATALGLPHIMDYRDPWTAYPQTKFPSRLNRYISQKIEIGLIARAKYIIVNTEAAREIFIQAFTMAPATKFHVVRNGFDQDLANLLLPAAHLPSNERIFTLLHTGNFYGGRNIQNLSKAIRKLSDLEFICPENFKVISYGPLMGLDRRLVDELGLTEFFEIHDFVSYGESLTLLAASSMSLLVVGDDHGPMIPAKFFDYLMVGRPVFCIGPKISEVKSIIEAESRGICVDISDSENIFNGLLLALDGHRSGATRLKLTLLDRYSIERQVLLLSKLIE